MKQVIMYTDPGHGWLRVPRAEVKDLVISHYSYQQGDMVYLEEDCDMPLYMAMLKAQGVAWNWDDVNTRHFEEDCPIRSMDQYIK